jgi:hypothetical protein
MTVRPCGGKAKMTHKGTMIIATRNGRQERTTISLSGALIALSLGPVNLVSVGRLVELGMELHLKKTGGEVYRRNGDGVETIITVRKLTNGMWLCNPLTPILYRQFPGSDTEVRSDREPLSQGSPTCFYPGRVKGVFAPIENQHHEVPSAPQKDSDCAVYWVFKRKGATVPGLRLAFQ